MNDKVRRLGAGASPGSPLPRRWALPLSLLAAGVLSACASTGGYVLPAGKATADLRADLQVCRSEAAIKRLAEDQSLLEHECMSAAGYEWRAAGAAP